MRKAMASMLVLGLMSLLAACGLAANTPPPARPPSDDPRNSRYLEHHQE
ncbi:hypothetical protein [Sporomusa sp.]|nr:hypothetical protein [Sporomusa sp.]HWR42247.1 hypothetical protein [Sporomusa sp.]